MKRNFLVILLIAGLGVLPRLSHPAVDVGQLEPVQVVQLLRKDGGVELRTDTGARGWGQTCREAALDMQEKADGILFLETAQFLLLEEPMVPEASVYELLRPNCRICLTDGEPDLAAAGQYLQLHLPEMTLARLRAGEGIGE